MGLTEDAPPCGGQAKVVDCHVVNWNPRQCKETTTSCVPRVRVKRVTHNEERHHCEGDWDDQRHLNINNHNTANK